MPTDKTITGRPERMAFHAWILFFSLILLSPFGIFYLLNINGRYIPEIGIILLLIFLIKKRTLANILYTASKTRTFIYPLAILLALFLIGCVFHGDLISAYSDLRVHVIFLLVFSLYYHANGDFLRKIEGVLLATSFVTLSLYLIFLLIVGNPSSSVKYTYPAAAYLSLMLLAAKKNNLVFLTASIILCIACAITSFYRGQWLLAALAILISLSFFTNKKSAKSMLKYSFWLTLAIAPIVIFFDSISSLVFSYFNQSESAYIHSIGKFNGLINTIKYGELQAGDDIRFSYYQYMAEHFFALMVPAGLGYDAQILNIHSVFAPTLSGGNTLDSFYLFSLVHYGFFSLPLLAALTLGFTSMLKRQGAKVTIGLLTWLAVYASLSAAFVTELSFAFFTAAITGLALNKAFSRNPYL